MVDSNLKNIDYNYTLVDQIQAFLKENPDLVTLKADYLAERSKTDNLNVIESYNVAVVSIITSLMFIFMVITLGRKRFDPIESLISIGLLGIIIIAMSVMASAGTLFYFDIALTPFTAEIVPYLVLAIGLDNLFIITFAERSQPNYIKNLELRIALTLKETGPSILITTIC